MVPHSRIIECLDLFGVAENIKSLLVNSMEKWKVMLCSGHSELGEVEIKRGIFQGDYLSFLVFALALIPLKLISAIFVKFIIHLNNLDEIAIRNNIYLCSKLYVAMADASSTFTASG